MFQTYNFTNSFKIDVLGVDKNNNNKLVTIIIIWFLNSCKIQYLECSLQFRL